MSTTPINPLHLENRETIRRDFLSDHPLANFTVLPEFVASDLVGAALSGCKKAQFETYCGFAMTEDATEIQSAYREPDEELFYVTVHQRSRTRIPEIARLSEAFRSPATIEALNEMTGAGISRMYEPDVLTYWNPGSFLGRHTDEVPHAQFRLVVSLSLTDQWRREYGGATIYAWRDVDREVRFWPRLNAAILFVPFSGSDHWVEQVSNEAPPLTRFTWTAFYA